MTTISLGKEHTGVGLTWRSLHNHAVESTTRYWLEMGLREERVARATILTKINLSTYKNRRVSPVTAHQGLVL
jgi:hypothetical protein